MPKEHNPAARLRAVLGSSRRFAASPFSGFVACRSARRALLAIPKEEMSDRGGESDTGSPQSSSSVRRELGDRAAQSRAGGGFSEESAEGHATKKTESSRWAQQHTAKSAEGRPNGVHAEIVEPAIYREDENENGGDRYAGDGAGQGARSRHAKHHARDAEPSRHSDGRRVAIHRRHARFR